MNHKRALFSLFDTAKADVFAKVLIDHGWQIIASNKTGIYLSEHDIPITKLADFLKFNENYGFSPTLHPKIEFGLTSDNPGENKIDLVYIINYPLSQGNDVGGHTILALAAKGKRIPVSSIEDMEKVTKQINQNGDITLEFREQLIKKAYTKVSAHFDQLANQHISP
jgi:AICAR transformylase/IMP cyclohydrolase PurH